MLASLRNFLSSPRYPSVLLVIGEFGAYIRVLHLLPEDSTIERLNFTSPNSTFRRGGATEVAREQIGTVTLHTGNGETVQSFLDDVEKRICNLRDNFLAPNPAQLHEGRVDLSQLVQSVLRPAALGAIHDREVRGPSMNATQTYPVFVVEITRARMGKILTRTYTEPSSIAE